MRLYSVNTGYFKLDGGAMFGVVPKVIWNKLNPADEHNLCPWALRSLLIEDGKRLILVDNGMGNKQDPKFFGHYHMHGDDTLDGSLARHGFHRNDITDVILTHLHFDHCGGSIIRDGESLVPAFSNAIYWSNTRHWEWATRPNDREKASFLRENILPIQESGQLRMIDIPAAGHAAFSENIQIRFVHGHTDGQMLPQVQYKGKTLVFMADLLPSVHHIPVPYVMAYDMFPLTSLHEKKAFVEEALAGGYILYFEHDPLHECCTLKQTDRGIRQQDCFALDAMG